MISISDIEEPTWPRSPPASVRTTRRRRCFERSSSGGVVAIARVRRLGCVTAIGQSSTFCGSAARNLARVSSCRALASPQLVGVARQHPALPALRHKLVQQDEHPAQAEQRKIGREPRFERPVLAVEPHAPPAGSVAAAPRRAACRDAAGYRRSASPDRPSRNTRNRRTPMTRHRGASCCGTRNRMGRGCAIPAAVRPQNQGSPPPA